ncbi:MAG: hypothetical protein LLF83_01130 [Methanobacterium sp.]|nr:hypothetical protein [Methanobacterium sp.]
MNNILYPQGDVLIMVYMTRQLKLESFDKWKPVFNERSAMRKEGGSKEASFFRNQEDENEVMILFEWDNMEKRKGIFGIRSTEKSIKRIRSYLYCCLS